MTDLLVVEDLRVTYGLPKTKKRLKAVDGVSFSLKQGETLGIVGESGCGKSTLARAIMKLVNASGRVLWMGRNDVLKASKKDMLKYRSDMQMIFQDPLAALNPRMTVGQIIAEPLQLHHPKMSTEDVQDKVRDVMDKVSLLPNQINRYPHEFSGGQCQRIGIARALILKPKLIICDEPVSALDVSIQAQVINLLMDLQKEMGLTLIFIAHDLSVVKHISDRVMVLYLGKVMELADKSDLYSGPRHPYTQALISAVPVPDPKVEKTRKKILLKGDIPSPLSPPSGCVFRTRCSKAIDICSQKTPLLLDNADEHSVACHFPVR